MHEYNAKPHYYKILDFGEAPYNDDNLNDMNYFVRYYTRKGNVTIWGQNLRQIVEESKLQKGEYARISKVGYELRPYQFDKTIKGKIYTISTARKVAKWDISIMNRAEKAFTKLPKVKITTTMKPKEVDSISSTKRYTKQEWAAYYANKKAKSTQRNINEPRIYTREQWARYNAGRGDPKAKLHPTRNTTIHISNAPALRNPPKSYADMCGMSQGNVALSQEYGRKDNKVLLPSNAQHSLSSSTNTRIESKERNDNRELRWTIGSDTGISRE